MVGASRAGATLLAAVLAVAGGEPAAAQQPTPGPAARAGSAIDHAVAELGHDVGEAMIVARVRIALLEHLKSDGLGIHIDVKNGEVVLRGAVKRRSSLDLAERAAAAVEGVRSVKSMVRLEVEAATPDSAVERAVRTAGSEVEDALLEAHVKVRLIDEIGRAAFAIEVEAVDGVVSLSGTVPDESRRQLARDTARRTSGVVELHDLLRIK